MEDKIYTIDQVAELLGVHHKTIRKLIASGELAAHKVGKQWRIGGQDLQVFLAKTRGKEAGEQSLREPRPPEQQPGVVVEITGSAEPCLLEQIRISTVIDIGPASKEAYIRISNTLIALANMERSSGPGSTIQVHYDEQDQRIRVILYGGIPFIEEMLKAVTALTSAQQEVF